MANVDDIKITKELMEAVAVAQLYRDDELTAVRKNVKEKLTTDDLNKLYRKIVTHPDFEVTKTEIVKVESCSLVEDTADTIALMYNDLLKEARYEKKYEVVIRILKEIQKLRAISDEESKFEIIIDVKRPEKSGSPQGDNETK